MSNKEPMTILEQRLEDLNKRKEESLKSVNDAYYDRYSPHYRDNERFGWAVDIIYKKFKDEEEEIIDEETSKSVVHYMTASQVLEKFEYCLDEDQIKILKELKENKL